METANHEYYVSLEVAKLLKEVGFDWKCNGVFLSEDGTQYAFIKADAACDNNNSKYNPYNISAPTLDIAQRWLRETQKYQVAVLPNGLKGYAALCFLYKEPITQPFEHYSTYEEALEAGIKRVLEIILEKRE